MVKALTPAQVIAGEAVSGTPEQRWNDMLNIASTIYNRAAMLGVSIEDVVSVQSQYNAYNKAMPAGTQSLVDMAQAALDTVQTQGPVNNATFYATPAAVNNLPSGLVAETETDGHQFFSDPAMRAIETVQGYIRPDPNALPSLASLDPLQKAIQAPYEANGLLNGVTSLTSAPATAVTSTSVPAGALDPAFSPSGLLSGNFPASSFTPSTPTLNNWGLLASAGPLRTDPAALATAAPYTANGLTNSITSQSALPSNSVTSISAPGQKVDAAFGPNGLMTGAFPGEPLTADPSRMWAADPSLSQVMQTPTAYLDAPEPRPNVDNFGPLAAEKPVQAPVDVQGTLGQMQQPNLAASAGVPLSASLFAPAVEQQPISNPATVSSMGVLATGDNLIGPQTPTLDNWSSLASASPIQAPAAQSVEAKTPTVSSWDAMAAAPPVQAPVSTPTVTTWDAIAAAPPVQAPQASQFGDINSPEMQAMKANAAAQLEGGKYITATPTNNNFAALAASGPAASQISATPTNNSFSALAAAGPLSSPIAAAPVDDSAVTQAMDVPTSYQPTPTPTASEQAISGILNQSPSLLSSTPLANQTPNLTAVNPSASMLSPAITQAQSFTPTASVPAANSVPMSNIQAAADYSMLNSGYHLPTANVPSLASNGLLSAPASIQSVINPSVVPNANIPSVNAPAFNMTQTPMVTPSTINIAQDPAVSMPSLPAIDTVNVADQPSIASPADTTQANVTVAGPTVTTAQDTNLSGSFPSAPAKTSTLGGLVNKGTLTGGILGTLAAGPAGGILGGLLGNQINRNGGLTGLLSGQAPNINRIDGGLSNLAGIWGGSFPAGTQALANNGTTVTSMGNGWTAVTSANGVTTTFGPNQLHAQYVGPSLTGDNGSPGVSGEPGGGGGVGGFGSLL